MSSKKKKKKPEPAKKPASLSAPGSGEEQTHDATPLWRRVLAEPVALGLAAIVLLRPWRDGLTFQSFNVYFTGFIVVLAAFWGARMLLRNVPIRFPVPNAIFALFLIAAYLTGLNSIDYNLSHRTLHNITAYFLLFFLCTNALRTRLSVGLVLGSFVLSVLTIGAWSIVHYYETLPAMRALLLGNSQVLLQFFGTTELTPDLKNRLEMNRAFGTFLFPNALGAFLVLGIPFFFTQLRSSWRLFLQGLRTPRMAGVPASARENSMQAWVSLAAGGTVALTTFVVPFLLNERLGAMNVLGGRPVETVPMQILLFGVLPVLLGFGTGSLVWRYGLRTSGLAYRALGISLAAAVSPIALWFTYSRGAMAALGAAMALTLGLYLIGGGLGRRALTLSKVALILLAIMLFPRGAEENHAQAQVMTDPGLRPSSFKLGRARTGTPASKESKTLQIEGVSRGSLMDLSSFDLRVTYWQVGLLIFQDNFLTGVGLGNFKTVYPTYQFLGAGDVEMAHNDFLQAFCETGVFGGGLFAAFWIYFAVWGGRRILREAHSAKRLALAGHYAGVIAFVLHAFVDFNFANPSLATFAFILAGTFYAHARVLDSGSGEESRMPAQAGRWAAVPLLILVAVSTASVLRMFLFDYALTDVMTPDRLFNIGDRKIYQARTKAAKFFIQELKEKPPTRRKPVYIPLAQAVTLIPDQALLESFGALLVPVQGTSARLLGPNEPVPVNAVVVIGNPAEAVRARKIAMEGVEKSVDALKEWDSLYPHDPDVSMRIFLWYDLLFDNTNKVSDKKRFARGALDWSRASVERSPRVAWFRSYHAKALWLRGSVASPKTQLEYYNEGIKEYQTACELFPISELFWSQYGEALQELGKAYRKGGRFEEGNEMIEEGKQALARGRQLVNYKRFAQRGLFRDDRT